MRNLLYLMAGVLFGVLLYKSEAVSWYRIQEMFQFKSFHMYGIIGAAVVTGALSIQVIRKLKLKSFDGIEMALAPKKLSKSNIIGGFIFGLGWSLAGACPGPIYILIGSGFSYLLLTLLGALTGTWVFSYFKDKLTD